MDPPKIDHLSFSTSSTFVCNGSSKAMDPPEIDPASFSTRPPAGNHGKLLTNFLISHPAVQFIQFQWQDLSGILRARIVTKSYSVDLATTNKPLRGPPCTSNCMADNTLLPTVDPRTTHWYFPDWSTLRVRRAKGLDSPYATVMCEIVETKALNPVPNCDLCPRRALGNVLETAVKTFGLNFLVGFEVEFMIMKTSSDGEIVPHSTGLGLMAVAGLRDASFKYVEECIFELQESGVQLQSFHTEGRRGQYEFALGPLPPMEAVDQLILVHDTIKRTFARHGYIGTYSVPEISQHCNFVKFPRNRQLARQWLDTFQFFFLKQY